jgi:hypothetical protein
LGAVSCLAGYGKAYLSVLEAEIAQAPQMDAAIDAYHATRSTSFRKPLRVVFFCPKDVEPFDDYLGRIDRIMKDLKRFLDEGMARNGFKGKSLNLEMDAGRVKVHLIRSQKGTADYNYKSGAVIKKEIAAEFDRRNMRLDEEHVLVICALAEVTNPYTVRMYAPYYGFGADQAKGLCFVVDCPWMDTRTFADTKTQVRVNEHNGHKNLTLGRFNTIYIGGTIHELGHGMSLPHNKERKFEKPLFGTALMGAGNYTYRQELRGKKTGTFLSFASATRLASLGLFNTRVKGLEINPVCELIDMAFEYDSGAIRVGGRIETDVPAYAVVAYNDPDGGSDYDAVPWTCAVKPDGTFSVAVRDLKPGVLDLRLTVCHANGAISVLANPYTCSEKGVPDIERLSLPWILRKPVLAYSAGRRSEAQALVKTLLKNTDEKSITAIYLNHLLTLCGNRAEPIELSTVMRSQKSIMLSDCRWESAKVGWRRPTRNEYCRESKDDTRVFLEIGDAFHPKGLYAHSPSKYVFDLNGKWKMFKTAYGLQRGAHGKVVFVVLADGKERFRSDVIEGSMERLLKLDIRGVQRLELIVENGGEGNGHCWSVWGSPEVLR